ncbi:Transglycosylase SLT domain-containing protein [Cupriavidus sp. YR651]|uniref:lytic transglycosylase domain-containing protein n=1 Tax=Cupriavidus sp. YR651 TaxID=1855315 RepID=UPI00088CB8E1|nr:lytic transglycosylase domain-containing protein [Cupriavidus sp. YR651]SDD38238.1 Transglycosylase SLT domain-containing protein [Cupriavidus sp. YR651]
MQGVSHLYRLRHAMAAWPAVANALIVSLVLSVGATPALAFADCFGKAGRHYTIDPLLLRAIAEVESAMNPRLIGRNANGTVDVGLMQINSIHFGKLAQRGITRDDLMNDPCVAVMAGAEILSEFVRKHGYTWRAVGAYNAGSGPRREAARQRYVAKVAERFARLVDKHARGIGIRGEPLH